jgi:hypothetical protein
MDPTSAVHSITSGNFLVKYDLNGAYLWAEHINFNISSMVTDINRNIIMTGNYSANLFDNYTSPDFDPSPTHNVTFYDWSYVNHFFITKFNHRKFPDFQVGVCA